MDSGQARGKRQSIELAIKRLTDEIRKLSDESNRALESAVFVGMTPEQERKREQRLSQMHLLLERLQLQQDELERVKRQSELLDKPPYFT
jgi:hypothetical protein